MRGGFYQFLTEVEARPTNDSRSCFSTRRYHGRLSDVRDYDLQASNIPKSKHLFLNGMTSNPRLKRLLKAPGPNLKNWAVNSSRQEFQNKSNRVQAG